MFKKYIGRFIQKVISSIRRKNWKTGERFWKYVRPVKRTVCQVNKQPPV